MERMGEGSGGLNNEEDLRRQENGIWTRFSPNLYRSVTTFGLQNSNQYNI